MSTNLGEVHSFESGVCSNERNIRLNSVDYIKYQILDSDLTKETKIESLPPNHGFCISTKTKMDYDPTKPVEYKVFMSISRPIIGKYCYSCGVEAETSVQQPFCANCQELNSLDNSNN